MKKSKLFLPLFALLFLAGCQGGNSNTPTSPNNNNSNTPSDNTSAGGQTSATINQDAESQNLLAYEAVTGLGGLDFLTNNASTASSFSNMVGAKSLRADALPDATIETIKGYLPTVEAALAGEENLITTKTEESDREAYAYKQTIEYTDMNNAKDTIVIYYNETVTVTDHDDDDDDWYETEVESKTFLEGIIIRGETEYEMKGKREVEDDESEISLRYYTADRSFVEVKQEVEFEHSDTEVEFSYKVVEEGRTISEYSMEIGNNKVDLESEAFDAELEMEFTFFKKNDVTYIKVEYENETTTTEEEAEVIFQKVVAEDGTVSYNVVTVD